MDEKRPSARIGWFLALVGAIGAAGAIVITVTANPAQPLGRLGLPVGYYGPILAIVGAAVLFYGIVIIARARR